MNNLQLNDAIEIIWSLANIVVCIMVLKYAYNDNVAYYTKASLWFITIRNSVLLAILIMDQISVLCH